MKRIEKTITIRAPADRVFDYLGSATHLLEIWPSLVEVKDVKPSPLGGENFRWVYKMVGMRFEGISEVTEFVKYKRRASKSKGGIESTFTWNFRPMGDATEVKLTVEYTIPVPLVGKMAEGFIVKANEHEADILLANLKDVLEIQPEPAR